MSDISLSATFFSFSVSKEGVPLSIMGVVAALKERLRRLIPASVIVGIVCSLGIIAMYVPGFILMALYLFVPLLIMNEADSPVSVYLNRSTRLAKLAPIRTLVLVMIIMLLSFALDYGIERLIERVHGPSSGSGLALVLVTSKMLIAMVWGALTSLIVCSFFMELKGKINEPPRAST
jgi:hypothetical protein